MQLIPHVTTDAKDGAHRQRQRLFKANALDLLFCLRQLAPQIRVVWRHLQVRATPLARTVVMYTKAEPCEGRSPLLPA